MPPYRQPTATCLTDFGQSDPYVAAMKGRLLTICPPATIVDISHDIAPQDILGAGFVLAQSAPFFPPGTVHVVVVDPGVGSDRGILAARFAGQYYIFPDNGVISFIADMLPLEGMVLVQDIAALVGGSVSATFHGRDIFAPLAGLLLNGLDLRRLGPQPSTYKQLALPIPEPGDGEIRGEVLHIDRYGNLISNITAAMLDAFVTDGAEPAVFCGDKLIGKVGQYYGQAQPGELLSLINSMGLMEIAVNQGRACEVLSAEVGQVVAIRDARAIDSTSKLNCSVKYD